MWYNDGKFTPGNSPAADDFVKIIASLEMEQVFKDLKKEIPYVLHSKSNPEKKWQAIVLGFAEDILVVRTIA